MPAARLRSAGQLAFRAARVAGGVAGAAARRQEGPGRDRAPQRPGGAATAQAQAGRRLHGQIRCAAEHSGVARVGRCAVADRMRRHQPRRAPTWWPRWWCSRTVCRANPTIGTSRSGRPPARAVPTTSPPSPRSPGAASCGTCTTSGRTPMNWLRIPMSPARRLRIPCRRPGGSGMAGTPVRLPAEPLRRRRWCPTGQRGPGRARRARCRRRRGDRAGQAAGGGVGALETDPLILPRNSEGSTCCSGFRDEAHRFAISFTAASGPSG